MSDSKELKIVLVGDSRCGKTAMLSRYLKSEFVEYTLPQMPIMVLMEDSTCLIQMPTDRKRRHSFTRSGSGSPPPEALISNVTNSRDPKLLNARVFIGGLPSEVITKPEGTQISKQIGAKVYIETSARISEASVKEAFDVAVLAAIGKLSDRSSVIQRQRDLVKRVYMSKLDVRGDLRDKAMSCDIM
ncbi:PREDICTED: rho-related GTP-binding protein RhoE-like [Priapulus caudatus]|uniref:Rho-related GTP-binding protein RhoE-like n=1 Tax=Priapulus caudatus TaxID=37621 RepID=A0ABM1ECA2_PRICU|nr:PREDICTED: rho-related GTP-binding protein RhoE-like [Priapulus caudatus]